MFGELNKKSTVKEGIDTSNMEFKKLREFIGSIVNPVGFFITEGKFGEQAVVVTEDCLINMPSYTTETFKNLSAEQIEAIKAGKMIITDIAVKEIHGRECTVFRYADK